MDEAGVKLLAKDLNLKDYDSAPINLSTLKKGELAKDLGVTTKLDRRSDEVGWAAAFQLAEDDAYAQTVFKDFEKVGDVGAGATKWDPEPISYEVGGDDAANIPSGLYIATPGFFEYGFGLPVAASAPHVPKSASS